MKGDQRREQRFWAKVNKLNGDGCWLWTQGTNNYGYGFLSYRHEERDTWLAHRLAYTLIRGPIPEGMTLDHTCRVRICVNPDHLEPVTTSENSRRRWGSPEPRGLLKNRAIRVPDDLWEAALARAEERGEYLSEAIRAFLEEYGREYRQEEAS